MGNPSSQPCRTPKTTTSASYRSPPLTQPNGTGSFFGSRAVTEVLVRRIPFRTRLYLNPRRRVSWCFLLLSPGEGSFRRNRSREPDKPQGAKSDVGTSSRCQPSLFKL